jgi:hypothetical protein
MAPNACGERHVLARFGLPLQRSRKLTHCYSEKWTTCIVHPTRRSQSASGGRRSRRPLHAQPGPSRHQSPHGSTRYQRAPQNLSLEGERQSVLCGIRRRGPQLGASGFGSFVARMLATSAAGSDSSKNGSGSQTSVRSPSPITVASTACASVPVRAARHRPSRPERRARAHRHRTHNVLLIGQRRRTSVDEHAVAMRLVDDRGEDLRRHLGIEVPRRSSIQIFTWRMSDWPSPEQRTAPAPRSTPR